MKECGPMVERLSDFPWIVVRVGCNLCGRNGQYRLAARFGPDISLDDLLDRLAADCPWRRPPGQRRAGKYDAKCHACYADLMFSRPPPDLPPAMRRLRVVIGGKR
jgi:hypothetical protein